MAHMITYGCDFFSSQSIAQDEFREQMAKSLPTQNDPRLDNINYESELQHAIDSFLRVDCLKSEELRRFTKCIFKLDIFRKLGLLLFEVCLLEFNLITVANKLDRLEVIREKIYDSLQELCVIFGKEKDRYLALTPLLYCAVLKKLFTVSKKLINADQKYRLFHVVFFELKGQLVSDQFLENLVDKHFNDNYNKFIKEYSENITPVKLKEKDKSLTKTEYKASLLEPKFTRVNKENHPQNQNHPQSHYYQTNKNLLSKLNRTEQTISPKNHECRRRL